MPDQKATKISLVPRQEPPFGEVGNIVTLPFSVSDAVLADLCANPWKAQQIKRALDAKVMSIKLAQEVLEQSAESGQSPADIAERYAGAPPPGFGRRAAIMRGEQGDA